MILVLGVMKSLISGPNGIENKELIFRCCEILENNLKLLRGQIYKPLTFIDLKNTMNWEMKA